MSGYVFCNQCGHRNPPTSAFCSSCGSPLDSLDGQPELLNSDPYGEGWICTIEMSDPSEFEGRHAYFADPEENYWEVVFLKSGDGAQEAIRRATD